MSGIIVDIQKEALDETGSISSLLRKVKLAAAKLGLDNLENWVDSELKGYRNELPDYRIIGANPFAWNPYNGWIPIHTDNEQMIEILHRVRVFQSIDSLQDLISKGDANGTFELPFPPKLVSIVNNGGDFSSGRMVHKIPRGSVITIIGQVRNRILDWAIAMEKSGITGQGISFDKKEIEKAQTVNIGKITNFGGNIGSGNTVGDITFNLPARQKSKELLVQIRENISQFDGGDIDTEELLSVVEEFEVLVDDNNTDLVEVSKIKQRLEGILVGASGNVFAQGILSMLTSIF